MAKNLPHTHTHKVLSFQKQIRSNQAELKMWPQDRGKNEVGILGKGGTEERARGYVEVMLLKV